MPTIGSVAGKLTPAKRKTMPASEFGLPKSKGYPMPDKKHARLAKSGAAHAANVGNISRATEQNIDAMADRKLGKSAAKPAPRKRADSYMQVKKKMANGKM